MSDASFRGERYILRRGSPREVQLGDSEWKTLEDLVGFPLPLNVREQIEVYAGLYAFVGPMYSQANTVLALEIKQRAGPARTPFHRASASYRFGRDRGRRVWCPRSGQCRMRGEGQRRRAR